MQYSLKTPPHWTVGKMNKNPEKDNHKNDDKMTEINQERLKPIKGVTLGIAFSAILWVAIIYGITQLF